MTGVQTCALPIWPYAYQGTLLYSGFTAQDIYTTDVYDYVDPETAAAAYLTGGQYNNKLWPNCIDPAPFFLVGHCSIMKSAISCLACFLGRKPNPAWRLAAIIGFRRQR